MQRWVLGLLAVALGWLPAAAAPLVPELVAESGRTFARPHDLTLAPDGAFLYVADLGHDEVAVLHPDSLRTVGRFGSGELSSPHDVAFDARGRLLVADSGNNRIAIYAVRGPEAELAGELRGDLSSPEGVAAGPDGRVYVTNAGGHTLVVFAGGQVVRRIGRYGAGLLEFKRPHDVEVDAAGHIHVADPGNNRVQILSPDLRLITILGGPIHAFNEPKYLFRDVAGWLFVADEVNDVVKVYDSGRRLQAVLPGPDPAARAKLNHPEGVAALDDRVWVSDTYNDRIVLFRLRAAHPR